MKEMIGSFTLVLNGLSEKEAFKIGNDPFGSLMWSKEEDGVTRSYPYGDSCFEIKSKEQKDIESGCIQKLVEAARRVIKYASELDIAGIDSLESALEPFKGKGK